MLSDSLGEIMERRRWAHAGNVWWVKKIKGCSGELLRRGKKKVKWRAPFGELQGNKKGGLPSHNHLEGDPERERERERERELRKVISCDAP